jgi:hypothetical protein
MACIGSFLSTAVSAVVNYMRLVSTMDIHPFYLISILSIIVVSVLSGIIVVVAPGKSAAPRTHFVAGVLSGFAVPFLLGLLFIDPVMLHNS